MSPTPELQPGDQEKSLRWYTREESEQARQTFSIVKKFGVDGYFLCWHRDDVTEVPMTAEHLADFSRRLAEIVASDGANSE